jgi:hypothetical protein
MCTSTGSVFYSQGQGSVPENVQIPVYSDRDPSGSDCMYPVGKRWINQVSNVEWVLTSFSSANALTIAVWTNLVANSEANGILDLLPDSGVSPVTAISGFVSLVGDSTNISTAGGFGSLTFNLSDNLSVTTLNLIGNGGQITIQDQDTTTACIGRATLVNGDVSVLTSAVTTSSMIFISPHFYSGQIGPVQPIIINDGSFNLVSLSTGDNSTYNYLIIN